MRQVLEFLGVLLLIQGAAGLIHELTGSLDGWGLVQRLGFLDGYEIFASVTLLVLAVALFAAVESHRSR
ncbi:hypothetical protein [Streptomyces sp. NPDC087300]|uniref:hypothetical protein n=1 Tax=Streptomyces sp. NPDC087300 TaxID=3365780 RepID=UPI00381E52A4